MIDEMTSLHGPLGRNADAEALREMVGFAPERLMELERAP